MKKIFSLLVVVLLTSCDALDECVMRSGEMTSKQVEVSAFDKILVNRGISMVISEGPEYTVNIVSGENLIGHIEAKVDAGKLTLTDKAECNWRRDYGVTTVFVTAPSLTEIRSQSEQKIASGNVLHFPYLHLIAIGNGTGDFHFTVDNGETYIESNNVSGFYLKGKTSQLTAAFYEGNGPLHAGELDAGNVYVFQRSSNHMYVKPTEAITGDIYSTGNVYCPEQPPLVDVREHYTGRLIFN